MQKFWATELAEKIIEKKGKDLTIATGISPSGKIHIGNMREVLTADFVRRELENLGAKVRFVFISDDIDRLRKLYPFLPQEFSKYIGYPLTDIPDPEQDGHDSYAKHFEAPFLRVLDRLGIYPEKLSATKMYKEGFYTDLVTTALTKQDEIKNILAKVSGRKMPDDWSCYNPICANCHKIDEAKVTKIDIANHRVFYHCSCGHEDWADYAKGQGKLSWRVDWPARWSKIPVDVEPYGKEHGTVGGSYDTGVAICKDIYKHEPPFGITYDLVYLRGFKGKMSSSLGNVVSADEFLAVVPPEILRFMFAKVRFDKSFYFDMGTGLLQLVDEYTSMGEKYEQGTLSDGEKAIYEVCQIAHNGKVKKLIPFRHLINAIQASCNNFHEIKRILSRTEHFSSNDEDLQEQITRANTWLEKYAPDNVRFSVQQNTPQINITDKQKQLLANVANILDSKECEAEALHNQIYESGKKLELKPKETFEAIYLALLGKSSGPKAGWFISVLDKQFVIDRFKTLSK